MVIDDVLMRLLLLVGLSTKNFICFPNMDTVKTHDDHFSKLIADVRVRETKRRNSSSTSSDAVTTPTNPGTSVTINATPLLVHYTLR